MEELQKAFEKLAEAVKYANYMMEALEEAERHMSYLEDEFLDMKETIAKLAGRR